MALVKEGKKFTLKKKIPHFMIKSSREEIVYKDVFISVFPLSLPGIEMSQQKAFVNPWLASWPRGCEVILTRDQFQLMMSQSPIF